MKTVVSDVRFLQKGTMCFGDLYITDGFVEHIDYKTPKPLSDLAINGFVDVHTHGFRGISCEHTDPEVLRQLAIEYAKRGTVGFVATLDALSFTQYEAVFAAYREAFQGEYDGARFYGIHMEGPYLNPKEVSDLPKERLKSIDLEALEAFLWKHSDLLKIMTIAPELAHGEEAVNMLRRFGVQASLGHTRMTYETAVTMLETKLHQVTHLCNAMPDLNHHTPSVMDAILTSSCMCELNMDGVHIQKPMLSWLIKLLGAKRIMAISDGSLFSGFEYPEGYQLDDHHVVKNNAIYYHDHLCSSFHDLLDAFQYLYRELKLPLEDCLAMTCINAGRLVTTLNYEIDLGKKADLVILDHNVELKDVIINGKHSL